VESGGPSSGSIGLLDHKNKKPASIERGMPVKNIAKKKSRKFARFVGVIKKIDVTSVMF